MPVDLKEHGRFAELACEGGYAPECSSLATLHQDGLGGREHSDAKAAELYRRACDRGAGIGCFNLASMIEAGGDGPADPDRAAPMYTRAYELFVTACDAGDAQWCANVGYMLEAGVGVPRDLPRR